MSSEIKRRTLPRKSRVKLNSGTSHSAPSKGTHKGHGALQAPKRKASAVVGPSNPTNTDARESAASFQDASSEWQSDEEEDASTRPRKRKKHQSYEQRKENQEKNYEHYRPHAQEMLGGEGNFS